MNRKGDYKQFIVILYEESFIFECKNNIININLNQTNNYCLYYLKIKG